MGKRLRNRQKNKGMTLIEVVIASAILSSALLISVTTYIAIVQLQQKGETGRSAQQGGRYILESIARDIRGASLTAIPFPSEITLNSHALIGTKVRYYHNPSTQAIYRELCNPDCNVGAGEQITPVDIRVTSLRFERIQPPDSTPYIEIVMDIEEGPSDLPLTDPYAYSYQLRTIVTIR